MRSRLAVFSLFCALLLLSSTSLSQNTVQEGSAVDSQGGSESPERLPIPDDEDLGFMRRSIIIVDDAQRIASDRFGSFMGQVDGFFSNAETFDDAVSNGSWARIRIEAVRANGNDFELDQSIKVRAVLPRTERKLKLLLSTEDDDSSDIGEVQNASPGSNSQDASLALRFLRTAREKSDLNFDVGVRLRDRDLQTFVRVNARYDVEFGDKWKARVGNRYEHFSKSGYGNRLSFSLLRQLYEKNNLNFRTYTQFGWEKGQKGAAISHTTGLYWQLGAERALALEGLAGYRTALNNGLRDRFAGHQFRIRWRDQAGRPWLYYEIWPSVAWPSETEYERTYGIFLRLEGIIGYRS